MAPPPISLAASSRDLYAFTRHRTKDRPELARPAVIVGADPQEAGAAACVATAS